MYSAVFILLVKPVVGGFVLPFFSDPSEAGGARCNSVDRQSMLLVDSS